MQEWNYALEDRPQLMVDTQGVLHYDREEPVENLTTWVYKEDSFVPCAKLVDGRRHSIISDYLGRAIQAYDEKGELVWNTDYDIYGKVRNLQKELHLLKNHTKLFLGQHLSPKTLMVTASALR